VAALAGAGRRGLLTESEGVAAARLSLRAAAGSTAGGFLRWLHGTGTAGGCGSGGDRAADADLGCRGEDGDARAAGREARPGLGLAVAVPVSVHVDAAAGQAGQDRVAAGRGQLGGQAGGGGPGPGGGCLLYNLTLPTN
jgi:hypothetical protein